MPCCSTSCPVPSPRHGGEVALKNGADRFAESFAHVELRGYDDAPRDRRVEAVVEYRRSTPAEGDLEETALGRIRRRVAGAIETQGCFRATKDAGLFRRVIGIPDPRAFPSSP